jgi:hypothetical protein
MRSCRVAAKKLNVYWALAGESRLSTGICEPPAMNRGLPLRDYEMPLWRTILSDELLGGRGKR